MFNINNNFVITLNRGDNFTYKFPLCTRAEENSLIENNLVLTENDTIYFGIMEPNQPFEHAIVRKSFTDEDVDESGKFLNISLNYLDTLNLLPGTYYYEIKLKHVVVDDTEQQEAAELTDEEPEINYTVTTLRPKRKFILL